VALNMKTTLFIISTWLLSMAAMAQDSPIGNYSMSEWAHYQLNVNRALETGQVGQLVGYTGNGVVGLMSAPSSGGSGTDTNAVAAVPDLATLTNSVTGYTKAIVGNGTTQKLYQKVLVGTHAITNDWAKFTSYQSLEFFPDGTVLATNNTATTGVGFVFNSLSVTGQTYSISFEAKANESTILDDYSLWTDTVWHTPKTLGTSYQGYQVSFVAGATTAMNASRTVDSGTDTLWMKDSVRFVLGSVPPAVFDPSTMFESAAEPGYGWQQVYLESQGGSGPLTVSEVTVTGDPASSSSLDYQFDPITDTIWVTNIVTPTWSTAVFTNQPAILPGSIEGQLLYITNGTPRRLDFPRNSNPTFTGSGVHSPQPTFSIKQGYMGTFRWRTSDGGIWDAYGSWPIEVVSAELLPAPWSSPGTNGVQTLSLPVKEALAIEMIPFILDNWQRLMPQALSNAAPTAIIVP